jgi:hypothetical protein
MQDVCELAKSGNSYGIFFIKYLYACIIYMNIYIECPYLNLDGSMYMDKELLYCWWTTLSLQTRKQPPYLPGTFLLILQRKNYDDIVAIKQSLRNRAGSRRRHYLEKIFLFFACFMLAYRLPNPILYVKNISVTISGLNRSKLQLESAS